MPAPPESESETPAHAGGWGALRSGMAALSREESLIKGSCALMQVNQLDGFDCPGCAWPEPKEPTAFEFCENGIKAIAAETTSRRADPDFFAVNPVSRLRQQSDRQLESHGRLTQPVAYNQATDRLEPISWEDAFSRIGGHIQAAGDPNRVILYTSGRTSNEAAFLYQLFGRRLGTNNFPDCSNMCHESSGTAMTAAVGIGKGTVTLEDFDKADAIFVIGQNPGTNHPRMLAELQRAAVRGARIVSINPLRERGLCHFLHPQHAGAMLANEATAIATDFAQPLIGGDLALLQGMIKHLFAREEAAPGTILDHAFIAAETDGFEALRQASAEVSWDVIVAESGLSRAEIAHLADIYAASDAVIICWAMGLTQHIHAVATIQEVVNLLLLRGNIGRPGAGPCPVRGHSNVQGDRTVGITERPKPEFLNALGAHFGFMAPTAHGLDVVAAIAAMADGTADIFIAMGGNFVRATPDTPHTAAALANCRLQVHIATKLNHSHLVGDGERIILPCLGRTERDRGPDGKLRSVSVEDSMSMVHLSTGKLRPASPQLKSEVDIVAGMAAAALPAGGIDWQHLAADYDRIRVAIEAVIPGFEAFNQRVRQSGGFHLRNSARERSWNTASGKADFTVSPLPTLALPPGQLRLMTIRSHDQYNTTVYADNDRYRGIFGERLIILMHPDDLAERGLTETDRVTVTTVAADQARSLPGVRPVSYDIPRGCAAMYFPEANVLVPMGRFAIGSRTPASKFVPVIVEKK